MTDAPEKKFGEFHNPDVQVTNQREIAARGLTPNHLYKNPVTVEVRGHKGTLYRFEHWSSVTQISIWHSVLSASTQTLFTIDVPHLETIIIHD